MRSLADALSWWPLIEKQASLAQLRASIKSPRDGVLSDGLRSVCWKVFLLFEDVDRSGWSEKLSRSRGAYTSLRTMFLRAIENPDELDDPLSEDIDSPWNSLRKDEELRNEIYQDVERCMPDNFYFRQPNTQNMLLDILFVWSKLNPDISYRQGMHEVLAPILWVVERDAVDPASVREPTNKGSKTLVENMFDAKHIAHDTFTLFSLVMQHAKSSYQTSSAASLSKPSPSSARAEPPMVVRSQRIVETLLAKTDPELASHLKSIDIIPQLFLMRWVRLLFGREFAFDEVLTMWDRMFAEDPSAECVDFICLAMLLRIRWQLMDCDNSSALSILLHYPEPPEDQPPFTFVDDALYLKNNLDFEGGHDLTFKYTNRAPPMSNRPNTPSTPQRPYSPMARTGRLVRQSGGFDKLLHEAAREVYSRGEKWGLNQAVRDAVGEVRKNVQGLQRTNSPSQQSSLGENNETSSSEQLLTRVDHLNVRNKSLAKMLEGAVNELWQQQKDESDGKVSKEKNDEKFTMAVAKVQLVQVYLEDSSLPLPTEVTTGIATSETAADATTGGTGEVLFDQDAQPPSPTKTVETPATANDIEPKPSEEHDDNEPISASDVSQQYVPGPVDDTTGALSPLHNRSSSEKSNRPPLTQSSFSWILGQNKDNAISPRSAFLNSTSPFTMPGQQQSPDRRAAARTSAAFLFGEDDSDNPPSVLRKGSVPGKGKDKGKVRKDEELDDEEVFRLGTLRWK